MVSNRFNDFRRCDELTDIRTLNINMQKVSILWFRNGLRIHDNGSLVKATEKGQVMNGAVSAAVKLGRLHKVYKKYRYGILLTV
jgi:hypothetical protein